MTDEHLKRWKDGSEFIFLDASYCAYVRRDSGGVLFIDPDTGASTALFHPNGICSWLRRIEEMPEAKAYLNGLFSSTAVKTRIA